MSFMNATCIFAIYVNKSVYETIILYISTISWPTIIDQQIKLHMNVCMYHLQSTCTYVVYCISLNFMMLTYLKIVASGIIFYIK